MVSAWGARNNIVLGQIKTKTKSNEITAIPELLNFLDINGCIVTIDAMGCQKKITEKIISKGADYVIAVKKNQPTLYKEVVACLDEALSNKKTVNKTVDFHETSDYGHGREEIRRYYILDKISSVESAVDWQELNTIGLVETIRIKDGKTVKNRRYYISSIKKNVQNFSIAVRTHWTIENSLHWTLDVSFKEDDCRIRKNNAASNFSILRRIAINYLKNEISTKRGISVKRKKAGWDTNYLEKIIMG